MWDIVGKRYLWFGISLLIIVPGILALIAFGFPLAIDFTGGSLLDLQFTTQAPQPAQVKAAYAALGYADAQIQSTQNNGLQIRTQSMNDNKKEEIEAALRQQFGDFIELSFGNVSATIGSEVVVRAAQTVLIAALGIMLYLWFAFRQVPHAFRYGVAAIIAMLHDVLVTIGAAAIFGKVFGWQVDSLYLTALLTVIGFSVHDTIVVFDRIRENLIRMRGESFDKVVNFSIIQTLNRSINTQLTVTFTLIALILFGGITIRHFVTIMLIGLLSGTYSSIFNAAQILVVWEFKEWRNWFRRKPKSAQAAA
ncbi:MAG TPA: protein translocase subunit SecF [Anaerolineae bacterium]|nr:protein translocase subunit SecF [Anaerolineae bacterium]